MAQQNGTVDVQRKNTVRAFALLYIRKKKAQIYDWKKEEVHIEQTKNTITFTHSPNKCHNIFTKHLFLVVVGHSFIFYYFILTYKKLTPQNCEICSVNITIYIKEKKVQMEDQKKKKVTNVAIVLPGTVTTVQN